MSARAAAVLDQAAGGAERLINTSCPYPSRPAAVAQGAHNTTGPLTWHDRQGWQELYSSGATSADAACSGLQDTARADRPFFCAWVGVSCNATLFANLSSCATLADSTGISRIEIVNNNLSGNLSSSAFMDSLQLLHDCGLRYLVLGGGYGELRGTMGPQWGDLRQLRGLSLFTTNLTGQLPDEIGQLTGASEGAAVTRLRQSACRGCWHVWWQGCNLICSMLSCCACRTDIVATDTAVLPSNMPVSAAAQRLCHSRSCW